VDASGNVYVADTGNYRIQKFTSTGTFLLQWGSSGTNPGQFQSPVGIATDASGNVYVADQLTRIQEFTSDGLFITSWSTGACYIAIDPEGNIYATDNISAVWKFSPSHDLLTEWGTLGSGNGQFRYPTGIAVDPSGNIFVADPDTHWAAEDLGRIQKFAQIPTSTAPTSWGALKSRYR
jgi:DNA-binding beta-propeller fold protein YncE